VASWILTPPADFDGGNHAALAQITARCAELNVTHDLVRDFAEMLCHRRGEHLEAGAAQAETSPVSELRGFAKRLRKDWAAVTAGLTVSYSSGPVEGHVNRIILWNQSCQAVPASGFS
jgi:transposase